MAEGRTAFKLMEQASQMKGDQEEKTMNMRVMIGSRPPRCEMRCNTCRHCEAVQVPAVPQDQNQKKSSKSNQPDLSTTVSMRGDDSSNYKPMSWKCKCGDMIFNP
ncbi:hypothetical protein BVC80_8837g4 [Macleaya cordata]|uniref:Epidermal patterning factor-like protein n=1 Tax=Macleaya cordata TaxID=56857 RepID=A0A200RE07_MACCD|nr:hypothetical protein BVC80_8837g4 [Macleaya cordata]